MSNAAGAGRLAAEGLAASRWGNGPGDRYGAHDHAYDKVIVIEQGSITFELTAPAGSIALDEGDRLELPAGTRHAAVVGPRGVSCLEAHMPAGAIAAPRRLPAGEW
jgi:quercetin dioxygenase-like cupin family protein